MKLFYLALIAFLLGCSEERNEVIITGQFLGQPPAKIGFTYPVNGTSFEGFVNTVEIDSLGKFQIILNIDKPAFLNFLSFGSPSLIIEPGNNYDILLSRNIDNILEISGNVCEAQNVYSSLPHQHPMTCLYSYGEDITNYHSIKQNLNNDLQKELSVFDELFYQNKISQSVLDLMVIDRKVYYYTAQMVLSSRNHLNKKSNNEEVPDDIFDIWKEAAYGIPLDNELLLSSFYSYDFIQMYLWYKIYTSYDYDDFVKLRAENRDNRNTHTHNIELAKEFLTNGILEFYISGTFFHQNMRRQYDNNLVSIFEQFKRDFPESRYLQFIEGVYDNMIEKQQELSMKQ